MENFKESCKGNYALWQTVKRGSISCSDTLSLGYGHSPPDFPTQGAVPKAELQMALEVSRHRLHILKYDKSILVYYFDIALESGRLIF